MGDMTFTEWMEQVDREVDAIAGVSVHDLADAAFTDWYEAGDDPQDAANQVLADNGWEG